MCQLRCSVCPTAVKVWAQYLNWFHLVSTLVPAIKHKFTSRTYQLSKRNLQHLESPLEVATPPHTYVITPLFHPQFINAMCILLNHSVLRTMGKLLSNLPSTPKSEAIIRRLELSTRAWHATRVLTRPKLFDQEAFCSCVLDEVVPLLSLTTGP